MENYQNNWNRCLSLVKENLNNERAYRVWFVPIRFIKYDPDKNEILLGVPSEYVCECIEQFYLRLFGSALRQSFGAGINLFWSIEGNDKGKKEEAQPADIQQSVDGNGRKKMYIHIPDARQRLEAELRKHLGDEMRWLPAYDDIARWLADNKGRGLLCVGTPGLGKSLICRTVLPAIIGGKWSVCSAVEMTANEGKVSHVDTLMKECRVVVDGLGTETVKTNYYGQLRRPFFDLCDAAEQNGNLLLVTTNLSTTPIPKSNPQSVLYPDSILNRYGNDVISRLRATTMVVEFTGEDMRH